ncbi:MAG: hypothetical protein K5677_08375 [Ruminococcus sp.]|nr:hypothetical protein [Ruminococcus sp.]
MTKRLFGGKPLPVSRGQEAMIYGEEYGERDAKAILIEGRRLHGILDVSGLFDSIRKTADAQEGLRMICVKKENGYFLELREALDESDLFYTDAIKNEDDIRKDVFASVASSMELDKSLFKVRLYTLENNVHILAVIMHHLIADNITLSVVINEIFSRYDGNVPTASAPYSQFLIEEAEFAASEEGRKQIKFWENEMNGYIPPISVGGENYDVIAATSFEVSAKLLVKSSSALKVSPFMLFLAASHIALGQIQGTDDTVIGLAYANRFDKKYRNTCGYLAHMVQNRIRGVDRTDAKAFVRAAADKMSENIRFQRLSHYARGSRVNIGMQGDPMHITRELFNGQPVERVPFDFDRNVDYLMINVIPDVQKYTVHLICDPSVYGFDYTKRLISAMKDSLSEIIGSEEKIYG